MRPTLPPLALALLLLGGGAPASAVEPVLRVEGMGGQVFLKAPDGKYTSFAGLGDWLAAGGFEMGARDTLVSTLLGQYFRRTQVTEVGGGAQVSSESLDNAVLLRWVHELGEAWSVKTSAGYRNELVSSYAGDSLGSGLLDYHKYSVGLDAERKGTLLKALALGLSAYRTNFYHYQAGRSPLPGAELRSSDRALDLDSYDASAAADVELPAGALLSLSALASYRDYKRQRIRERSEFLSTARGDVFIGGVAGVQRPAAFLPTWLEGRWGVNAGLFALDSNQNDYDLDQGSFHPDFYSYVEWSVSPWWSMAGSSGWSSSISYVFLPRRYLARPLQAADGSYVGGKVRSQTHTAAASFSYPLSGNWAINANASYTSVSSNTDYEANYRYNYSYAYYFMGLSWSL